MIYHTNKNTITRLTFIYKIFKFLKIKHCSCKFILPFPSTINKWSFIDWDVVYYKCSCGNYYLWEDNYKNINKVNIVTDIEVNYLINKKISNEMSNYRLYHSEYKIPGTKSYEEYSKLESKLKN